MTLSKIFNPTSRCVALKLRQRNHHATCASVAYLTDIQGLSFSTHRNNAFCRHYTHQSKLFFEKFSRFPSTSVNFVSCMSTTSNEKFQVIYTDPKNVSTTSTESSSFVQDSTALTDLTLPTTDVVESVSAISSTLEKVVEPSLASLDLGHWTPVGLVQMFLEYLHIQCDMPWWLAIVACTVTARILLVPLLIKTQRNAINMSNHMPQLQFLQMKFGEARRTGNSVEASRYATEIMYFMKEHKISPLKNAMLPMLQAPVFLSFFLGLRAMAKAPVESMKEGGIWWATDLTIPDPIYVMPIIACGTLYIVLKIGAESGVKLENLKLAKYFVQAMPVIALPFCINFPAAVLYYWCANNFCTLGIVSILKLEPVRKYLNLPKQVPVDPQFMLPKKGFVKGVKDAIEDQRVLAAVEDRRKTDEIRFQKSGTGPVPRTYAYDPTKPRPANAAAAASRNISSRSHKT
ncbi:mitochondrial inner membrane protein OXA1L-like [Uloborus diversus]|uniref:mitochondrial inner membrane protein OXA1L-like n=1 Tax=Uloborus diversus TaxID=327109 RepID=UPI002408FA7A|nr:mitochondrial inner membrane protein OXA1L-like [Uloborus diversus]